jgi:hypothetical protein
MFMTAMVNQIRDFSHNKFIFIWKIWIFSLEPWFFMGVWGFWEKRDTKNFRAKSLIQWQLMINCQQNYIFYNF